MRKVIVVNNVSLDGVMQAPGRPDEDTRGGFKHGGWAAEYNDEVKGKTMAQGMSKGGDLLFGRRTMRISSRSGPGEGQSVHCRSRQHAEVRRVHNAARTAAVEKLDAAQGDAADAVAKLKSDEDADLTILGSGVLVQSLMRRKLVDQITLLIHPLTFGTGRRLFAEDGDMTKFRLDRHVVTTTGVIIATYIAA